MWSIAYRRNNSQLSCCGQTTLRRLQHDVVLDGISVPIVVVQFGCSTVKRDQDVESGDGGIRWQFGRKPVELMISLVSSLERSHKIDLSHSP